MARAQSGSFQWWANYYIILYYEVSNYWYEGSNRYANLTINRVAHSCSYYDFSATAIYSASGESSASGTVTIPRSGSNDFSGELGIDVNSTIKFRYTVDGDAVGSVSLHVYNYSVKWLNQGYNVPFDFSYTWNIGSLTGNIGQAYTTPNISITSINGVNIPTGSGNYNININGNQNITIGYSAWSGAIFNDSCSINAWIRPYDRSRNLSYKTIRNDGNGKPAGSSLYRAYNNANDPATPIGSGVPFAYDNQQVWIYAQRHHSSTGSNSPEVLHSNVRLMRILYTPIKSITFTKQPIGLYESRQSIDISWSYPTPPSLIDQYGIVSGYEIRLINKDTGQTELIDSTVSTSYTLASNDYNPLTRYCFQILPYYLNRENKSYGPSKNSNDFMLITKLSPPTINYPNTGTNCVWIGNKLYVLAQLPFDPDASYVENYEYKNLEVIINGVTYTFESNSDMFSIGNLTHNAKFVFTTKNINIPFSTSYIIKTRVQKNYSFDGIDYRWSEYSTIELKSVQVPSIPIYSGYVMASHYNSIYTYVRNMRNCYIESNDSVLTTSKSRGIQINRSNFQNIYNDLNGISQLIDQWGEYSKDLKVEFSQNNLFSPKIEYITDKKNDTDPTGNNYFILSYEWIRYYG